jgi:hypothetical protein
MEREFHFHFTVVCAGQGRADRARVEQMIDLAMQELVYDDEFIAALDEKEAVTIQVMPVAQGG